MAKLTMVALEKMIGALSERINDLENPTTPDDLPDYGNRELAGRIKKLEDVALEDIDKEIEEMLMQGWRERIVKLEKAGTPEALAKTLGEVAALRLL